LEEGRRREEGRGREEGKRREKPFWRGTFGGHLGGTRNLRKEISDFSGETEGVMYPRIDCGGHETEENREERIPSGRRVGGRRQEGTSLGSPWRNGEAGRGPALPPPPELFQ
jgi:hypothetical protein